MSELHGHLLAEVARAAGDLQLAALRLRRAVRAARRFGCRWTDIGTRAGHSEAWARATARGGDHA